MSILAVNIGGDFGRGVEAFTVHLVYCPGGDEMAVSEFTQVDGAPPPDHIYTWYHANLDLVLALCRGVVAAQVVLDQKRVRTLGVESGGYTAGIVPDVCTRGLSRELAESIVFA